MREIGGYIELDKYFLTMIHENAIKLDSARNALAYIIRAKSIKKISIPLFLCDSVKEVLEREGVEISYYPINFEFLPQKDSCEIDEYIYVVNYYGQLNNKILKKLKNKYRNIIVDNVQAYFQKPIKNIDTLYTCRKFFGVPDGAILYTDVLLTDDLPFDKSFNKMKHILGRFESTANEFYQDYRNNDSKISNQPIMRMSKLTENLLRAVNYSYIKKIRTNNFKYLHNKLKKYNKLNLIVPTGAFMYPLYVDNGNKIREILIEKNIYVPILWPEVLKNCDSNSNEYTMAQNILPIVVDQRYTKEDMKYLINEISKSICSEF